MTQREIGWQAPMLPLFEERTRITEAGIKRRLYLIPTQFGEQVSSSTRTSHRYQRLRINFQRSHSGSAISLAVCWR